MQGINSPARVIVTCQTCPTFFLGLVWFCDDDYDYEDNDDNDDLEKKSGEKSGCAPFGGERVSIEMQMYQLLEYTQVSRALTHYTA